MVDNINKLRELCNSGNLQNLSDFIESCTNDNNIQWLKDAAEQGDNNTQFALLEYYYFQHTAEAIGYRNLDRSDWAERGI